MKLKPVLIALAVVLGAGFASPPNAVRAQSSWAVYCPINSSSQLTLYTGTQLAQIGISYLPDGVRFTPSSSSAGAYGFSWAQSYTLNALGDNFTSVTVDYTVHTPRTSGSSDLSFSISSSGNLNNTGLSFNIPLTAAGSHSYTVLRGDFVDSGFNHATATLDRYKFYVRNFTPLAGLSYTIHGVTISGTGINPSPSVCGEVDDTEYARPLRDADYSVSESIHNGYLFAYGNRAGLPVHAATSGTITSIRTMNEDDCIGLINAQDFPNPAQSMFRVECPIRISGSDSGVIPARLGLGTLGKYEYQASRVVLTDDDNQQWIYFVNNVDRYIALGIEVERGCIIGETFTVRQMSNLGPGNEFPFILTWDNVDVGGAIINPPEPASSIARPNGIEPDSRVCYRNPQATNALYSACIAEIDLSLPALWNKHNAAWDEYGGVRIQSGGWIESTINLNLGREPVVLVAWRWHQLGSRDGQASITVGGIQNSYPRNDVLGVGPYQQDEYEVSQFSVPDVDPFYKLRIDAPHNTSLDIDYICIYNRLDAELNPVQFAPDFCYFSNWNFTSGLTGWTPSDSSVTATAASTIVIPDGESISQQLTLYTNEYNDAIDYTVTVTWGLRAYSGTIFTDEHYLIDFEYKWGGYTSNNFVPLAFATPQLAADNGNNFTTTFILSVSASVDAPLELRFVHSALDPPPVGVNAEIRSVCITSDFWPMDKPTSPFNANCPLDATRPAGADIGLWTQYLWSNLNRFFQCDLMKLLNRWYAETMDFMDTARWFMRWMIVSFNMTMDWVSTDILFWLNGHFSNLTQGNVTFIEIESGTKSCNNLFCALDSLFGGVSNIADGLVTIITSAIEGIISPILDFFLNVGGMIISFALDLILRLVDIALWFIGEIINLLRNAGMLFSALINGLANAEPTQIPALPYCWTNPEGNLACRLFWALDNTIFSGPGEVLPAIIVGYLTILLILWVIKEIKTSIQESGNLIK